MKIGHKKSKWKNHQMRNAKQGKSELASRKIGRHTGRQRSRWVKRQNVRHTGGEVSIQAGSQLGREAVCRVTKQAMFK